MKCPMKKCKCGEPHYKITEYGRIAIMLILFALVALYFDIMITAEKNKNIELSRVKNYWSCMDGCSNMQEIIFGLPDYSNETAKNLHHECSDKCCIQTMPMNLCKGDA